jgi:hypothetical protein
MITFLLTSITRFCSRLLPQYCPEYQPYCDGKEVSVANLRLETGQHRRAMPIIVAVKAGARDVIRTLLIWKSQVNCRDPVTRQTPLDIATDLCYNDIIEILREAGAKLSKEIVNSNAAARLSVERKTPVYVRNQDSHP